MREKKIDCEKCGESFPPGWPHSCGTRDDLKTPNVLLPALRQYQHNDCSGLLAGFDHEETVVIVSLMEKKIRDLTARLRFLKPLVELAEEAMEILNKIKTK